MQPKSSQILKRRVKDYSEWIEDPLNKKIREESMRQINRAIRIASRRTFVQVAALLDRLSIWDASSGVTSVSQGYNSGWIEIHKSCHYILWASRIYANRSKTILANRSKANLLTRLRNRKTILEHYQTYSYPYANRISHCLSYLLAIHTNDVVTELGDHLKTSTGESADMVASSLVYFMIWIYSMYKDEEYGFKPEFFGVYKNLVTNWEDSSKLQEYFWNACEYHCNRIDVVDSDRTDFATSPFDLIPFELLAFNRLRQIKGLPTVEVKHPLFESAFSNPNRSDVFRDDILSQVSERFTKVYG